MPKRTDISSILIIGSGPIQIGQGCEFDYSGSQACRALRNLGFRVVLVNSNPATIMTDPGWADATYLEPLDVDSVTQVIAKERPDALLAGLGGQTALNLAVDLAKAGVLDDFGVELIGTNLAAIQRAEDRQAFRTLLTENGLDVLDGLVIHDVSQLPPGMAPAVVRPAFTLGGTGGGLARAQEDLVALVEKGIHASPVNEVLVERSVEGWLEFELEVMCDAADNCIVVCSIENLEPVGVHTGDSWTVAPQQTLSDPEYQRMRDMAFACVRAVGLTSGGANVQFAYDPVTGDMNIIEMNPRASRSSALASKATGYPIAKIAALLAVGFTLDELPNDITGKTTAAFEPSLDYVAVKGPRFDFEKFDVGEPKLGTQMQATGEVLALGRTFAEAFLKAVAARESQLSIPNFVGLHSYFESELESVIGAEHALASHGGVSEAKRFGLGESRIAELAGLSEREVRQKLGPPGVLAVDSCAGEFEAATPYFYLSREESSDQPYRSADKPRVLIIGSGPNRIGQGIEFDYSCVHAIDAFRAMGFEVVMVNSNPSTVSTDYDTSDRLYIEPLTAETVLNICEIEKPVGVVVSLGGQTPLNLVGPLSEAGIPIVGDPATAIEKAEDRGAFGEILDNCGILTPKWRAVYTHQEALEAGDAIGYPVMIRPHHVLGGSGMKIVNSPAEMPVSGPALVDQFLPNAIECDVEVLSDGDDGWVAGILEHIEPAGVHSGDSACVIPAPSVGAEIEDSIRTIASTIAHELGVRGFLNLQLAISRGEIYVLEANPRASRTVPFLAKATGLPIVEWACRLMMGEKLSSLDHPSRAIPTQAWAKESIFPVSRFSNAADRGPSMRSTGEVMAGGSSVQQAYARVLRMSGAAAAPGSVGPSLQELAAATATRAKS